MTSTRSGTRRRTAWGLSLATVLLAVSGCSDDAGSDDDSPGDDTRAAGAASPEEAYAAFAAAVRDDDPDAFEAAVHKGYWSDLSPDRAERDDHLHDLHWAVEEELLSLPEKPDEVLSADELGISDSQAEGVGSNADIDGLTTDGVRLILIEDSHVGVPEACFDEPGGEDCSPSGEPRDDAEDVHVVVLRDGSVWRVAGIEPVSPS